MIQITFNFTNIAAATALLIKLNEAEVAAMTSNTGVSAEEKQALVEAPGKSRATTARSKPTAEAAVADAPAVSTEKQAAEKPTVEPAAATSVAYPDLQKAVLTLHKMDPTAAVPIAKGLGADTFKLLPQDKWAEALRLVNEAITARGAA